MTIVTIAIEESGAVRLVTNLPDPEVETYHDGYRIEANGVIIDVQRRPRINGWEILARNPKIYGADLG